MRQARAEMSERARALLASLLPGAMSPATKALAYPRTFRIFAERMRSVRPSGDLHSAPALGPIVVVLICTGLGILQAHAHSIENEIRHSTVPHDTAPSRFGACDAIDVQSHPHCHDASNELKLPTFQPNEASTDPILPADKSGVNRSKFLEDVCLALGREASANDLPAEFFTRLIWQESRFNPRARSHKGAEGIAQFMPGTARWRGLADSYEPFQALRESARWLAELREQFGNLGLAAAAYNAGPGRIQNWLSGRGALPSETRHYVRVITGRSAEEWSQRGAKDDDSYPLKVIPCTDIAKLFIPSGSRPQIAARSVVAVDPSASGPWGLQLAGNWSESRVLAEYQNLQGRFPAVLGDKRPLVLRGQMAGKGSATWYRVRVAESTRERATVLCNRLKAAGGMCLVFRN